MIEMSQVMERTQAGSAQAKTYSPVSFVLVDLVHLHLLYSNKN